MWRATALVRGLSVVASTRTAHNWTLKNKSAARPAHSKEMRKLFLHIFVACMMFYVGIALSKPIQPAPPRIFRGVDELQLVEIFKQYGPAQTTHDRAFFERVESDHFILFQPYRQLTREEDIRVMDTLPMGIKYTWEIENIRVFGDSAVVTGQMRSEYRDGSSYSWGSINVCIKTTKGWQILSTTSNY